MFGLSSKTSPLTHLREFVAIIVTVIWAVSIIASLVIPGFVVDPSVQAAMGGLVAFLFFVKGRSNGS